MAKTADMLVKTTARSFWNTFLLTSVEKNAIDCQLLAFFSAQNSLQKLQVICERTKRCIA